MKEGSSRPNSVTKETVPHALFCYRPLPLVMVRYLESHFVLPETCRYFGKASAAEGLGTGILRKRI